MNLSIVDAFKKNFPDLDIKTPTWAVLGVTAEFRKLQVGDIVLFPIDSYNYQREFGIRNAMKQLNRQLEKVADSFGSIIDI